MKAGKSQPAGIPSEFRKALYSLLVLANLSVASAQQPLEEKKDIPTIARDSLGAVVVVVGLDGAGRESKQGSGFVVSPDGKVVTNYHVIEGAGGALVKFQDGGFYQVEGLAGTDRERDLAILKVKASGKKSFPYLRLGNSKQVVVGDSVLALGNPLALEGTVSSGIISGIRQASELGLVGVEDTNILQTTVPISPGSSGGPLVNLRGEVIGVTTFYLRGGQNVNFAVPASYVLPLLANEDVAPLSKQVGDRESEFEGTYTGIWESSRFFISGAAVLKVSIKGSTVHGEIFLTGGEVKNDLLVGTVTNFGDGVLAIKVKAEKANLSAKGIFRNGTFIGDYFYDRRWPKPNDRGQWILHKQ